LLGGVGAVGIVAACSAFSGDEGRPASSSTDAADGGGLQAEAADDVAAKDGAAGCCTGLFSTGFDDEPFDGVWDGYERGPQSQIVIFLAPTEEAPRSPGRALRIGLPETDSLYQSNYLKKRLALPPGARTLTYQFAIRVKTPNTRTGGVKIAGLSWGKDLSVQSSGDVSLHLVGRELTLGIQQDGGAESSTATRPLVVGRWYAMKSVLIFNSPNNATVESFVDDVSYDKSSFVPVTLPDGQVELRIGAEYATEAWTPSTIDVDDVSFDAT
jgi:hypothetical protein